jgi:hypothetical protein
MHDCPGCQVPLHGHEAFCPVCGEKQYVRPEFQGQAGEVFKKSSNPVGLILVIILVLGLIVFAIQSSWIGQLIKRGPEPPPGDSALSAPAAREKLEKGVLESLAGQSKSCKFVYTASEKSVDRNYPQAVELAIEVNLKDPSKRKSIVEPVKALMVPALINTLVLNDSHSHATITYSVAGGAASGADSESDSNQLGGNSAADTPAQTSEQ